MKNLNTPGSIERTVALSEIHAILHRYAVMAKDKVDFSALAAAIFWPDGTFRLPNGMAVKPADMAAVVQGEEAGYIRHHITSIDVNFTSPTEARTVALYLATTDTAVPDHWGHWEDIFTYDGEGKWMIADRTIVVDGCDPKGWFGKKYRPK